MASKLQCLPVGERLKQRIAATVLTPKAVWGPVLNGRLPSTEERKSFLSMFHEACRSGQFKKGRASVKLAWAMSLIFSLLRSRVLSRLWGGGPGVGSAPATLYRGPGHSWCVGLAGLALGACLKGAVPLFPLSENASTRWSHDKDLHDLRTSWRSVQLRKHSTNLQCRCLRSKAPCCAQNCREPVGRPLACRCLWWYADGSHPVWHPGYRAVLPRLQPAGCSRCEAHFVGVSSCVLC